MPHQTPTSKLHLISDATLDTLIAVVVSAIGIATYLATMEPTVSFWDCGEFITTSAGLQIGHPPGAPLYSLLAHCLTLFATSDPTKIALLSNALSALSGGITIGFLYASLRLMMSGNEWYKRVSALIGSLCYLFCDTAWFSATESEVYSLSMLFSAVMIWAMLRFHKSVQENGISSGYRWLILTSILTGLSIGVHQLSLLTIPSLLIVVVVALKSIQFHLKSSESRHFFLKIIPSTLLFFALGLSVYLIIPIRSAANPPINCGKPSTAAAFRSYVNRDQYAKAPLWPRSWKDPNHTNHHYAVWRGKGGDVQLMLSYQMGYMYLRYLMWNFSGRFNDKQGFGSLQNGQFLTGLPLVDRALVGTSSTPPPDLAGRSHNTYFMLPLILGLLGIFHQVQQQRRSFWVTLTLFLMGGLVLGIYMNHPVYEPRERDYAYILSFYAFTIWIAYGALYLLEIIMKAVRRPIARKVSAAVTTLLLIGVPTLMAQQNWDDHNRAHRYIALDVATNILNSCDENAILITYGDNDTFPLWYAQHVEKIRTDVEVTNVNLAGGQRWLIKRLADNRWQRPVYFSHYMYNAYSRLYPDRLQLEGLCYRLMPTTCETVATEPFCRHLASIRWHNLKNVHIDPVGQQFIDRYWADVVILSDEMLAKGDTIGVQQVLSITENQLPVSKILDAKVACDAVCSFERANMSEAQEHISQLKRRLSADMAYYNTMNNKNRNHIKYSYGTTKEALERLEEVR